MKTVTFAVDRASGSYVRCRTAPELAVGYVGVVEADLPDRPTISQEVP